MYKFSNRSYFRLRGVRPELVAVASRALAYSTVDFGITEGVRTLARQKTLVASGASRTLKSRHLTGHAIDVVAYVGNKVRWDWPLYELIADAFAQAASELDVDIRWGGSWVNFRDGPHYQLKWKDYPV